MFPKILRETLSGIVGRPLLLIAAACCATAAHAQSYTFTTFAGTAGSLGSANGTGVAARFDGPKGVAVDVAGNVYVADSGNAAIRKITSGGVVTTLASGGTLNGGAVRFVSPEGVAVDGVGNVYVADAGNFTIWKVTSGGVATILAGAVGSAGATDGVGSGARFYHPTGVAVDSAGNVYVADRYNHLIRKITSAGVVTTVAGAEGASGAADGSAGLARFNFPSGVALDAAGSIYVADTGSHTIRKITSGGVVTTLAGKAGVAGSADGSGVGATFYGPTGVAVDGAGNIFVTDNLSHLIRKVTSSGAVTTLAGTSGIAGSVNGVGNAAQFYFPSGAAVDSTGKLWIADAGNYTIRQGVPASGPAPQIQTQPASQTVAAGGSLNLTVAMAGAGAFQFQWFKDGVPIANATAASLQVASTRTNDAGAYHVEVTSAGAKIASQVATVVVLSPPTFVQQPLNGAVEQGFNASFSVVVAGSPAPTLQWLARTGTGAFVPLTDGGKYSGTRQALLRISSVDSALNGWQVQVKATNAGGAVDSAIATLRVAPPNTALKIKTQPQSQTVKAGGVVRLVVEMEVDSQQLYQWRKDGWTMDGATQRIGTWSGASAADAAGYSVVVRDDAGGIATSNTASVTVVGAVDATFDPKGGPNGPVTVMIALSDGGYLSAGAYTRVAGLPRAGLAKFRRDGTVVAEFDPGAGPNGTVRALVELAAGKILVVGQFDRFNGVAVPGVVRLDSQGRVDATFSPVLPAAPANDLTPLLDRFHTTAIGLSGGGYLLGGKAGIVALAPTGAFIAASVYSTNAEVFALLQQFNGGIIIGGEFTSLGSSARARLARLLPDLRIDTGFDLGGTGPNSTVQSLLRTPEGWIYALGDFSSFNGKSRPAGVVRIAPTGRLDDNFNPPLASLAAVGFGSADQPGEPRRLAAGGAAARGIGQSVVQPNGGIILPSALPANPSGTQSLASVDPATGGVSTTFDVSVTGAVNALAVSDNEGVTLAGSFSSIAGTDRANVAVVSDDSGGSRVVNLSTRGRVGGGDRNLFLGFVIKGPEAMRVLIRGVGPTLRGFGITDPLVRPQLTIFDGTNTVIMENQGWRTVADPDGLGLAMKQVGAFDLSTPDDAAVVLNLTPGNYTAQISGLSGGQGVALGEVYALDQGNSRLINLSVRGAVGTGDDVLIPAFVVTGGSRLLLMRTIGPGLTQFGLTGTLVKPLMELRRNATLLETNQGWTTSFDPAAIQARTPLLGAFPLSAQSADSAVLTALSAGAYTVTARGGDGGTGIALVEIYDANGIEKPVPAP